MSQRPVVRAALLAAITVTAVPSSALAGFLTASASRDATIYSGSGSTANGAGQYLFAGRTASGALRRALLHFDLSSIPEDAAIVSATLNLHLTQAASGEHGVSVHRVLASWTTGSSDPTGNEGTGAAAAPADATWTSRSFGSPTMDWANAGGDIATSASAFSLIGTELVRYSISSAGLAADVQAWLADPAGSNHGWILIGDETVNQSARRFGSADGSAEFAPTLEVEWAVIPAPGAAALLAIAGLVRPRRRR
jgi:hypothetical protein